VGSVTLRYALACGPCAPDPWPLEPEINRLPQTMEDTRDYYCAKFHTYIVTKQGRSQKLHVGGGLVRHVRDGCRITIHPTPPPRFPLRLVYTQKYLNVFECTQPYFMLLQEMLNFFLCSLGGLGPPGPPLATPLWQSDRNIRATVLRHRGG